jgi:hypothetical protein
MIKTLTRAKVGRKGWVGAGAAPSGITLPPRHLTEMNKTYYSL